MDSVDLIKSRLSIDQVVARYVPLKKAGRNFKALCPFHKEKTPSFYVTPEKQIAYCFSCQKGGDIFSFIQEIEGLDFRGSLQFLADMAGVTLEQFAKPAGGFMTKDKKEILYDVHVKAQAFYVDLLWGTPTALAYLQDRGLTDETIKLFGLGLSPDSFEATYSYLLEQGFTKPQLIEAGMVISKDTGGEKVYDRFRHRIMFPIADQHGRTVAFTGRVIRAGDEPKYLNSSDTLIYNKSNLLYGLHLAKPAIKETNTVVIVEGNMDVIASYQSGVKQVVATCGTALTPLHVTAIQRLASRVSFCFDQDAPGQAALKRAVDLIQPTELSMQIINLTTGKDPDEVVKNNPENWRQAVTEAKPYMDFYFEQCFTSDFLTLDDRKQASQFILTLLKGINQAVERDHYLKRLATFLQVKVEYLYEQLKRLSVQNKYDSPRSVAEKESKAPSRTYNPEEYLLALLINFPQFLDKVSIEASETYLSPLGKEVYQNLKVRFDSGQVIKAADLFSVWSEAIMTWLKEVVIWVDIQFDFLNDEEIEKELRLTLDKLKLDYYDNKRKYLIFQMKEARQRGDPSSEQILFKEYSAWLGSSEI